MQILLDPFTQGDIKPVAVVANPSDRAHVTSGTWTLVEADSGAPIPQTGTDPITGLPVFAVMPTQGNVLIDAENDGSMLTTDNPIKWLTVGSYVCRFSLTWSDGQVDNTASVKITVQAPAT